LWSRPLRLCLRKDAGLIQPIDNLVSPAEEFSGNERPGFADDNLISVLLHRRAPFRSGGGLPASSISAHCRGSNKNNLNLDRQHDNPIFRFISRFFLNPAATMEAYLKAMGGHFGQAGLRVEVTK